ARLPYWSRTRTLGDVVRNEPASALWPAPNTTSSVAVAAAIPVTVNSRGSRPATETVTTCSPRAVPSVQLPIDVGPEPVTVGADASDPPPAVTATATGNPATAAPDESRTVNAGAGVSGSPTAAVA